jgi:hypothetical protein
MTKKINQYIAYVNLLDDSGIYSEMWPELVVIQYEDENVENLCVHNSRFLLLLKTEREREKENSNDLKSRTT